MTLRVIIVDDEPLALSLLSALLADIEDVTVIEACSNGRQAVEAVIMHQPDLMFLDIQMPEMNGFDVIAAIQNDVMPLVIFTTAYAEYAVDAFKVQAIDYVLKPLEDQAIKRSISRARTTLKLDSQPSSKHELLPVLHDISERVRGDDKSQHSALIVKDTDRISFLDKDRIEWLEAAGDYVCIHIDGATRLIRSTLKSVEIELSAEKFQRIHRSTIINMSHVKDIVPAKKGEAFAIMNNGSRLKISRSYGSKIRKLLS